MIIGINEYGEKCVYDLPRKMEHEEFKSLICGYHFSESTREELQGQPILKGFAGPMFGGFGYMKKSREKVAIIRYEDHRRVIWIK